MKKQIIFLLTTLCLLIGLCSCVFESGVINTTWYLRSKTIGEDYYPCGEVFNDEYIFSDDMICEFLNDGVFKISYRDGTLEAGEWVKSSENNKYKITMDDGTLYDGVITSDIMSEQLLKLKSITIEYELGKKSIFSSSQRYQETSMKYLPWSKDITRDSITSLIVMEKKMINNEIDEAIAYLMVEGVYEGSFDSLNGTSVVLYDLLKNSYFKKNFKYNEYEEKRNIVFTFKVDNVDHILNVKEVVAEDISYPNGKTLYLCERDNEE